MSSLCPTGRVDARSGTPVAQWYNKAAQLEVLDLTNITKPSGDVEQYLEDLYRNLPEKPSPYCITPLSGPLARKLESYFPPGFGVAQLSDVPLRDEHLQLLRFEKRRQRESP